MRYRIAKAKKFATEAHASINHVRKYTGEPYIVHPAEVASIVSKAGGTEEEIMAAWLHDTVEDTPVTPEDIAEHFGPVVAEIVEGLTDVSVPEDGNRKVRKAIDLEHSANASASVHTVKLADLISNSKSIVEHDLNFARVYLVEKEALLAVLTKGNKDLHAEAYKLLQEGQRILIQDALNN